VAVNDTCTAEEVVYRVTDVPTGGTVLEGYGTAAGDAVTALGEIPFLAERQTCYGIWWRVAGTEFRSHYMAGRPPFDLATYRRWMQTCGVLT